jgi:hypothetical protein
VKTVKKKLDKAIEETGKIANKINRATASLEGMNQIDFEELKDANKPLHHRVPNFIGTMKTPAIVYDEGMRLYCEYAFPWLSLMHPSVFGFSPFSVVG